MKIVGFGDSFTVGIMGHHQRSYIANLCQLPESPFTSYENYAFGGSSNWAIAYQVYRYVAENQYSLDNTFLFIAWSSFSRYSILNKRFTDWSTDYQQAYQIPDRRTEEPPSSSKLLIYETDVRILGISNLLKQHHISHAMVQAFDDHTTEEFSMIQQVPNWINQGRLANTLMHIIAERYLDPGFDSVEPGINHNEPGWINRLTPNQYIDDTYHPTDAGNWLIAKTLYPYLQQIL